VVEEYNRREQEIKHLEKELEEKTAALNVYRQNISEVLYYVTTVFPMKENKKNTEKRAVVC